MSLFWPLVGTFGIALLYVVAIKLLGWIAVLKFYGSEPLVTKESEP
jgi:hypothetical protein